jgi:hypothetical protein
LVVSKASKRINQKDYMESDLGNPFMRIIATAFVVGGVSFAGGFIGPILFSESNLGPLVGFLVTGPLGTLLGALIGIVWSALRAQGRSIQAELWSLGCVGLLTLLYYLWLLNVMGFGALMLALGLEGLVVASGAFFLGSRKVWSSLPEFARTCGSVLLCAAVLIVLASMFPPVTQPWWVPAQAGSRALASEALPKVAFFLDSRFDGSWHDPEFAVDIGGLVREWCVIAAVAGGVSLFIVARRK